MNRLAPLDYLRGLSAIGIMFFHYTLWSGITPTSADFSGRIGVYGVVLFYVLSGITLGHVYYDSIGNPSKNGLIDFGIKRIARIFPLLWLLTIATLLIKKEDFPLQTILLNLSGLFSIYHWGNTVCYGAWSIGNELAFYLFFPVFVLLIKRSKALFIAFSLLLFSIYLWYTFVFMDSTQPLSAHYWLPYINPLNQVFYFLSGFIITWLYRYKSVPVYISYLIIAISILAFIYYPVNGDTMLLISGINRVVFTLICILICFACYKINSRLPLPLHWLFGTLGEISYCLYLIHPLTAYFFPRIVKYYFPSVKIHGMLPAYIFTIIISWIIFHTYEKPFMRLGKYLSKRLTSHSEINSITPQ